MTSYFILKLITWFLGYRTCVCKQLETSPFVKAVHRPSRGLEKGGLFYLAG